MTMTDETRQYLMFRCMLIDPAAHRTLTIGMLSLNAREPIETVCLDELGSSILQSWLADSLELTNDREADLRGVTPEPVDRPPRFLVYGDIMVIADSLPEVDPEHFSHLCLSPEHRITIPRRCVVMGIHRTVAAMFARPNIAELGRSLTHLEIEALKRLLHRGEGNLDLPVLDPYDGSLAQHFVRVSDPDAVTPSLDAVVQAFKKDNPNG